MGIGVVATDGVGGIVVVLVIVGIGTGSKEDACRKALTGLVLPVLSHCINTS